MDLLKELESIGAVFTDRHFVYTSGKHGSGYINLDLAIPDTALMTKICAGLVAPFARQNVDTVTAPAVGGIALAVHCGRAFADMGEDVAVVWADKAGGGDFVYERAGFTGHLAGKRVLLVEDLVNTGGSVAKTAKLAAEAGAELVGASVVGTRSPVRPADLNVPRLEQLTHFDLEAVDADQCSMCQSAVPIVENIGHGADYRLTNPDYAGGYIHL